MSEDPRITRSRAAILSAAHTHVVSHGYAGTTLDDIATAAGVSKRTIYNIYCDKETLFRAVVERAITIAEGFSRDLAAGLEAEGLEGVAVRLARSVLDDRVLPLRRLLIGESRRFPELARAYYDRAPGLVMSSLAVQLAEQPGLAVDDPALAAEHFAFLVLGAPLDRALFDPTAVPGPAELTSRALAGVATFRRAYSS